MPCRGTRFPRRIPDLKSQSKHRRRRVLVNPDLAHPRAMGFTTGSTAAFRTNNLSTGLGASLTAASWPYSMQIDRGGPWAISSAPPAITKGTGLWADVEVERRPEAGMEWNGSGEFMTLRHRGGERYRVEVGGKTIMGALFRTDRGARVYLRCRRAPTKITGPIDQVETPSGFHRSDGKPDRASRHRRREPRPGSLRGRGPDHRPHPERNHHDP